MDAEPAARTRDRCQLTPYYFLDEGIFAKAFIDAAICTRTQLVLAMPISMAIKEIHSARLDRALPQACCPRIATVEINSHQNSHQTILSSPISRGKLNLNSLFCWCREGGSNPHDRKGRRILSPNLGMLQQAARQRTDSHYVHRMKDLSTSTILQDVAAKGSNVAGEHAPEYALNH